MLTSSMFTAHVSIHDFVQFTVYQMLVRVYSRGGLSRCVNAFISMTWMICYVTCFYDTEWLRRCKKLHFYNLSNREIVDRLQTLACKEELEVEEGVLSLVASRSNGSIHEAEILLDQLSLVEKRVSLASVHELVSNSTRSSVMFAVECSVFFVLRQMFCLFFVFFCFFESVD